MSITISPEAAEFIKKSLLARGSGIGIKIGIKTSGCSGLAYTIEYVDKEDEDDEKFYSEEIKILVDKQHLVYLCNTVISFKTQGVNSGLEILNPNAKNSCGCGESFTV
jgi:iron-sulfur cluster assembly protein